MQKSNDIDHIHTTDAVETQVDSSFWLKPSRGVRSIVEDTKGNLWFGATDFVCMYNGSTLNYFEEEGGLCGNKGASRMMVDQQGTVWIQAGSNLCSYDGKQFTSHTIKPSESEIEWDSTANYIWVKKEVERFGNTEGLPGVYGYHQGEFTFLKFPVPPGTHQKYNWMTSVVNGQDGTIWFGTMEAAIGFKGESSIIIGREEMGLQNDPHNLGIRAIFEDSKGNIWLGDNGVGLFMYNGDSTINFTKLHKLGEEDTDGNSLHRIFSISEDDTGNMWFGTVYSGIWRYNPASGKFTNFTEKDGFTSELIWTIFKTKQGELLFAAEEPGAVFTFNGTSFERTY